MPARAVQISLDSDLLERIDAEPEARTRGRSAFIRLAVEQYLAHKRRQRIEADIAAAYRDHADELLAEAAELMDAQVWPDN